MKIKLLAVIVSIFVFQCALAGNGNKPVKEPSELELRVQALEDRVLELESFHPPNTANNHIHIHRYIHG